MKGRDLWKIKFWWLRISQEGYLLIHHLNFHLSVPLKHTRMPYFAILPQRQLLLAYSNSSVTIGRYIKTQFSMQRRIWFYADLVSIDWYICLRCKKWFIYNLQLFQSFLLSLLSLSFPSSLSLSLSLFLSLYFSLSLLPPSPMNLCICQFLYHLIPTPDLLTSAA